MKNTLTFLLIAVSFTASTQNSGFFGKTGFVEVNSALSYPLFNRFSTLNSNKFGEPDKLATAVNFVFGKAVSRKISLSLEAGVFFGNFSAEEDNNYYDEYYTDYSNLTNNKYKFSSFENISYRTVTIMPKIEISGMGGNAPGGLTHQIGIGYTSSKIKEKDYEYRLKTGYTIDPKTEIADYDEKYKGFTLLYGVVLRYPISKTLLFNYGVRTTLNLTKGDTRPKNNDTFITAYEAENQIQRTRFRTVFNLQLGFTYLLF